MSIRRAVTGRAKGEIRVRRSTIAPSLPKGWRPNRLTPERHKFEVRRFVARQPKLCTDRNGLNAKPKKCGRGGGRKFCAMAFLTERPPSCAEPRNEKVFFREWPGCERLAKGFPVGCSQVRTAGTHSGVRDGQFAPVVRTPGSHPPMREPGGLPVINGDGFHALVSTVVSTVWQPCQWQPVRCATPRMTT